jgi:hypothetical protein
MAVHARPVAAAGRATGRGLHLHAVQHELLPPRLEPLEPRQRYVEYRDDLHRLAGQRLDPRSARTGDQYTRVQLADALLRHAEPAALAPVDVLVTTCWTDEYDPDFSAFGPHMHHRLGRVGESFDVVDRGSISPLLALMVMQDYLAAGPVTGTGLLLAVEQTTVPQAIDAHFPGPRQSSAGLIRAGRQQDGDGAGAELVAVRGLSETEVLAPSFRPQRFVSDWCEELGVSPDRLMPFVRRNTHVHRLWNHWADEHAGAPRLHFLPAEESCMNLWRWLDRLPAGSAGTPCLLLDEDVDSPAAAAVMVRT